MNNETQYLERPGGRIAYHVLGSTGPLLIAVPGMGDIRQTYRFIEHDIHELGFRFACMDLRGHGESDATFAQYDDETAAEDILALAVELGADDVVVMGNSMGAAAAVLAASQRTVTTTHLILIGPFVRDPRGSWVRTTLMKIATRPAWLPFVWTRFFPTLFAQNLPADFEDYLARVRDSMRGPGRAAAISRTMQTSHAAAEKSLPNISAKVLVVMGMQDPDFPDPQAEAQWVAQALGGQVNMVDNAGHYPQSQQPERFTEIIKEFLSS